MDASGAPLAAHAVGREQRQRAVHWAIRILALLLVLELTLGLSSNFP